MSKTAKKTTAELRRQFDELLEWFESDDFTPEEAVDKFQQAEAIAGQIEQQLTEYKNTISVLKQRFDEVE